MASKKKQGKDINSSSWTAKELLEAEIPEVSFIVEGLLPQGMFWMSAGKKIGKSYLALQLMIAVASKNKKFLGKEVKHGKVLYISFEDNPRRVRRRLITMQALENTENIEIEFNWTPLNKGGFDELKERLSKGNYVLCILDTWAWAFELKDSNKIDEAMKYLKPIHNITKEGKVCIGFIDHNHKTNQFSGQDWIDDIGGTGGKGGIADTIWQLNRKRGQQDMTLNILSKDIEGDIEGIKLTLKNGEIVLVEDKEVKPNTIQSKIISKMYYHQPSYVTEIASVIQVDKSVVSKEMTELQIKGIVEAGDREGRRIPFYLKNGHESQKKVN